MEDKKISIGCSSSFTTLLQIAFIVLKLCKVINWSWVWVLAPTWISLAFGLLIAIICIIMIVIWGN